MAAGEPAACPVSLSGYLSLSREATASALFETLIISAMPEHSLTACDSVLDSLLRRWDFTKNCTQTALVIEKNRIASMSSIRNRLEDCALFLRIIRNGFLSV